MPTQLRENMVEIDGQCQSARKASWNIEGVEPGNQEGPG